MLSTRWFCFCGLLLALLLGVNIAQPARADMPLPAWKPGDDFLIKLTVYPRKLIGLPRPAPGTAGQPARPPVADASSPVSFDMHVRVLPLLPSDKPAAWKLQFAPVKPLPVFDATYQIWLGNEGGKPSKGSRLQGGIEQFFALAGDMPILSAAFPGYPMEILPAHDVPPTSFDTPNTTLEVKTQAGDAVVERTAIIRIGNKPEIEIRQRWKPGAKWWSEYERFYQGKPDLLARLADDPKPPPPPVRAQPAPPPSFDDYRGDPRLQVPITADLSHCTLQDLLDLLSSKTKVELTMAQPLAETVPLYAGISCRFFPAWKIMEQVSRDNVVDGRWDKTDTGYQLSATQAVVSRYPSPPPAESKLLRACVSGLLAALIAGVSLWLILHRKKPIPSPSVPSMPQGKAT